MHRRLPSFFADGQSKPVPWSTVEAMKTRRPSRAGHQAQATSNIRASHLAAFLFVSFFVCSAAANQPPFRKAISARQAVDGDGYGGDGFTVLPLLSDEKQATAIVIHGLGGTGEEWGFISLALSFFSLNYVKFIIPTAPVVPVTYLRETMPSWFDISELTRNSAEVNKSQLLGSMDRIHTIIRGEVDSGVSADRIFVVGFSQGGALALTSFLRSPWTIGGCVGVATWLPLAADYPEARSSSIEDKDILMLHGSADVAVRPVFARKSRDFLRAMGQNVTLTMLEGEPHIMMNRQVLEAIELFISTRAQGTTQYLKTLVKDLTDTFAGLTTGLDAMPRF